MKALSSILAAALFCTATTAVAAGPRITATRIEQERAVIQGETDPSHELVLRIDDGSSKPQESRSWARSSGKFEYVVQVTDRLRLEGGKRGIGIEASCTIGNSNSTAYITGQFTMRPTATVSKDGIFTFAYLQGDDGRTSSVSLCIDKAKK